MASNKIENFAPENKAISDRPFVPHVSELTFGNLSFFKALYLGLKSFFHKYNHEDLPHVVERYLDVNKTHSIQVCFQLGNSCLLKIATDLLARNDYHIKLVTVFDERLRCSLEDRLRQSCQIPSYYFYP